MEALFPFTAGAPASTLLLAAIVVVSLLGLTVAPWIVDRSLLRPHGLVERGEYATLVTSGFVHADVPHLLFNGFTFWAFAFGLERAIGTPRFVLLYAAGLLASSVATWALHRKHPGYSSLGASGAILAVLFASIVAFPKASLYILPIPVPVPAPLFAIGYLAYSVFASRSRVGRINHDAHIAGAIAGLVFMAAAEPQALGNALRAWFG